MNSDHHSIEADGDDLVVETPFGTARFELKGPNEAADENMTETAGEWPDDYDLEERWHILFQEVEVVTELWRSGEL